MECQFPLPLADCTPPPLPLQLFVLEGLEVSDEGDGGLEGGAGALSPFTHKPNYTVPFLRRC